MATRTRIAQIAEHVGEDVELRGWLYNLRSKGKIHFLQIRDGSGLIQGVMGRKDVDDDTFELAGRTAQEASVIVTGSVRADDRAPGGFELGVTGFELVAAPKQEYPIQIQQDIPNVDKLLEQRHLWLRSRRPRAIMRVRNEVIQAARDFLYERGFTCVDAPIFTPAACEGTSTLFPVEYFDLGEAYLTQSGQLYMEAAAMALGRVYCFGPTFRAEKSKTRRHLTEFWMLEPELAYCELDELMDLIEEFVAYLVLRVLERCATELAELKRDTAVLERYTATPYPRVSYLEACEQIIAKKAELLASDDDELKRLGEQSMSEPGGDFGAPDETVLGMIHDKPVLVHRFPAAIKAFYMKPDPADAEYALCVDMIAPEGAGEIIGGSQREDDYDALLGKLREHSLPEESFQWYLDLRRYGTVPHSGFGLGLERTVGWICGVAHVRECIAFPRMLHRIYP